MRSGYFRLQISVEIEMQFDAEITDQKSALLFEAVSANLFIVFRYTIPYALSIVKVGIWIHCFGLQVPVDVEAQFGAAIYDVNFTLLPLVMWNRLIA
jgi:hypothetical protein